ncbi:MAG: M48 family metalloprotease, partial [Steroidobacteraceae bacterium]
MDFYSRQAAARRHSRWLVLALGTSIALVVLVLSYLVLALFGSMDQAEHAYGDGALLHAIAYAAANPELAAVAMLFWFSIIMLASVYRSLGLREGGGAIARSLGASPVVHDTRDPSLRRLRNVVEEMAIASGITVPAIYVLDGESAINAFAAGHSAASAAITVTRGAVDQLSREELQGVIAHEFSHILNGDMRLNVRLMGWLYGLIVIALIGRLILRVGPRGSRRGGSLVLVGVAMLILGQLGAACGRVIQAAVCRSRERLADASAVQYTRNPSGLKGALLKIMGLSGGSRLANVAAEEVAHMLFAAGGSRLFDTHPPLAERICTLDPTLRAKDLPQLAAAAARS